MLCVLLSNLHEYYIIVGYQAVGREPAISGIGQVALEKKVAFELRSVGKMFATSVVLVVLVVRG